VIAPPIEVATDADRQRLEAGHAEMQRALERVRDVAEGWFRLSLEEKESLRQEFNGPVNSPTARQE